MHKILGAVALVAVLVACGDDSASTSDYQQLGEEAAVDAAEDANPDFTATAACEEPSSTDAGTTFACTVTYDDGDVADATAVIVKEDGREGVEVEVQSVP